MKRQVNVIGMVFLFLFLVFGNALSQERELLYSKYQSDKLKENVAKILDIKNGKIPYEKLKGATEYFVRIAPREYILDEKNKILESAILGTKPLVFITTPESIYGRSLLDIYLGIGYETEDIIKWQRGADMVAIVFKYSPDISISDIRDGKFQDNWQKQVFVPTWDNMFSLFNILAKDAVIKPEQKGEFAPEQLFFRSEDVRMFVLGFPQEGKNRIKAIDYAILKAENGADWVYRNLLEKKLSVFEHFRGNGRTHDEVEDPDGINPEAGFFEFVGPNRKVNQLPELAIIHLGKLNVADTYTETQCP